MNSLLLTVSGLVMRLVGMGFQAWLASRIGASGIGLYQLTGTITVLFTALSVSGIRFAATRLVSEEVGAEHYAGVRASMRRCTGYALFFGLTAGLILFLFAEPLGFLWVGDARTVRSLQIAALGMPVIALSSLLGGYFTAVGRVWKAAGVQLLEQTAAVGLVITLLHRCAPGDLESVCAAITGGNVAAGIIALLLLIPIYLLDRRRFSSRGSKTPQLTRRMLAVALPLAFSSYTRTALSTLEHLLIPSGLRISGLTADAALAGYGLVHGMALSAVLFPACLLFAMAELLVPELTEAQMQNSTIRILRITKKMRQWTLCYALVCSLGLMLLSRPIAEHIFHTLEAQKYILLLAPLVPIMNLDTITDACLRGLGQQQRVMRINILDAAVGVMLVWVLVPMRGIRGYIEMIWLTECGNLLLSTLALHKALKKESSGKKPEDQGDSMKHDNIRLCSPSRPLPPFGSRGKGSVRRVYRADM